MSVRMLTGDCREILAALPDASVQLCVTSPPYFGLRDYGTASWDGGDAACDHVEMAVGMSDKNTLGVIPGYRDTLPQTNSANVGKARQYRDTCGKCGATRVDAQIGLEPTVEAYVAQLVAVFHEVRRVLRDDGVLFLNLGDSYASAWPCNRRNEVGAGSLPNGKREARPPRMPSGLKEKDLIGIPWRVAFALQADGWYLRSDIIWAKPNPMPESVRDRPTKAHEYIFLLTKSPRYFWDAEAVKEPGSETSHGGGRAHDGRQALNVRGRIENLGTLNAQPAGTNGRNIRSIWTIATAPFAEAHFATFPPALAERCIKAGTSEKGACRACGAPWVRVVERGELAGEAVIQASERPAAAVRDVSASSLLRTNGRTWRETTTTGWQPTCHHHFDSIVPVRPCVVLDPFGGAGTVSLVAERLGRDSIYVDLSPEYTAMARSRILGDAPMLTTIVEGGA